MMGTRAACLAGLALLTTARGFLPAMSRSWPSRPASILWSSDDDLPSDSSDASDAEDLPAPTPLFSSAELKTKIFAACAASDRGFAASPTDRREIEDLLDDLAALGSPIEDATHGLMDGLPDAPLKKCWRLIYTSAADVSTLAASPISALGGIYQDARDLPLIVNVIDSFPRALANLPPSLAAPLATSSRIKVQTRARPRSNTRVGLTFEAAELAPLSILGQEAPDWLPSLRVPFPQLGLDLQRQIFGVSDDVDPRDADTNPSYFDVTYLDEDFLVIKQGSPGGMFAAVSVSDLSS